MAYTTAISSAENTIKILQIQYPLNFVYQQIFYHDKQKEMNALFDKYQISLFKNIDHLALIQEWKQNLDAAAYEKNVHQEIKIPPKKKEINCHGIMTYCPTSIREVINWFPFMDTMGYTADMIENDITLLS